MRKKIIKNIKQKVSHVRSPSGYLYWELEFGGATFFAAVDIFL